jgi:hypothetical protein
VSDQDTEHLPAERRTMPMSASAASAYRYIVDRLSNWVEETNLKDRMPPADYAWLVDQLALVAEFDPKRVSDLNWLKDVNNSYANSGGFYFGKAKAGHMTGMVSIEESERSGVLCHVPLYQVRPETLGLLWSAVAVLEGRGIERGRNQMKHEIRALLGCG